MTSVTSMIRRVMIRSALKPLVIILAVWLAAPALTTQARAQACTGRFVNPITDICWDCVFPITIGSMQIVGLNVPDTPNPGSPICWCGTPIPRIGITVGFWEPLRLVDVSRAPGCFSNLGGIEINPGSVKRGATGAAEGNAGLTRMHAHYYHYPVWTLLEALIDVVCLDPGNVFDIAWVSELDPLWMDDRLTFLIHPEAALFGSLPAQAACAADCAAATAGLPLTETFWCAGCQGGMYPMTGNIPNHVGGVQASLLVMERLLFKLHRELVAWGSYGEGALCARFPMPVMDKRQYRFQMTQPVAMTVPKLGCNPAGRTSVHYEGLGGEWPGGGENWGWLVWRKRSAAVFCEEARHEA